MTESRKLADEGRIPVEFYQWLDTIEKDVRVWELTPNEIAALITALRDSKDRDAVLEEARRVLVQNKRVNDAIQTALERHELIISDEGYLAALTTPAPAAESDWFAGDVDCDGNELVTIRADELQKLRDEREKFMWQVRDTCTRAEKAEAALAATPAVSRDEILEVLERCSKIVDRNLYHQSEKVEDVPRMLRQLASRIRGEGE